MVGEIEPEGDVGVLRQMFYNVDARFWIESRDRDVRTMFARARNYGA